MTAPIGNNTFERDKRKTGLINRLGYQSSCLQVTKITQVTFIYFPVFRLIQGNISRSSAWLYRSDSNIQKYFSALPVSAWRYWSYIEIALRFIFYWSFIRTVDIRSRR